MLVLGAVLLSEQLIPLLSQAFAHS
jgi:hypothetical protein